MNFSATQSYLYFVSLFMSVLPFVYPCPEGWKRPIDHSDDYCYYVSETNISVSWFEAKDDCEAYEANLVTVHRKHQIEFLRPNDSTNAGVKMWIGLHFQSVSQEIQWADGSPLIFEGWDPNITYYINSTWKCVFTIDYEYWYIGDCRERFSYICQKIIRNEHIEPPPSFPNHPETLSTESTSRKGPCLPNWKLYGNKCYRLFGQDEDKLTWNEADNKCRVFNKDTGRLASVHNQMEQYFLTAMMGEANRSAWIGLILKKSIGTYIWSDNTVFNFTDWNIGMYDPEKTNDICVEILERHLRAGKWNRRYCSQTAGYICQMNKDESVTSLNPVENNCEEGFIEYREECYRVFNQTTDWDSAEEACALQGGTSHLVSVMDAFEQAFITLNFGGNNDLWIGFSDGKVKNSDMFVWSDNWPTYFTNWGVDEPKLDTTGIKCTVFGEHGFWRSKPCSEKKGYICKSSKRIPPVIERIEGKCTSSSWIDIKTSKCYYIDTTYSYDFQEAEDKCRKFGADGRLASFHSKEELLLLVPHMKNRRLHLWLGLKKERNESMRWLDNSPVDYFNWADWEPSRPDLGEECVEMYIYDLTWNDVKCSSDDKGIICQTTKLSPTTPVTDAPFTSTDSDNVRVSQTALVSSNPREPRTAQVPQTPPAFTIGKTSAIVIGVSFVIAALVGLYYFLFKRKTTRSGSALSLEYYRFNPRDEA